MAALTTAMIATAAIGAGASIYATNQQKKAIKNAANQQTQAQNQAINFAREGRDHATRVLSKYSAEGDAARGRMNAFLGIKPAGGPRYAGGMGGADYAGYVAGNEDLNTAFNTLDPAERARIAGSHDANGDGQLGQDEYGRYHYETYGQAEGRQLPGSDPNAVPAESQEEAWAAYEASPWGKTGVMEAGKARDDFLSMAGAQGGALAGRTARGMSEVAEEAKLRNFGSYYGALGGVADMGYSADTGIASGGQQFADRAANITMSNGRAQADLAIARGNADAEGINDLASWIGWGMGKWEQPKKPAGSTGSGGDAASGTRTTPVTRLGRIS